MIRGIFFMISKISVFGGVALVNRVFSCLVNKSLNGAVI